ncbi:hypothetical protein CE143_06825 [Photorhabdus luminescens]|uniref:Immunity protein 42 n=2 Tax=Photorhabdus TaxID=29487 RepID=A0A2S8PUK5_9GAMM|nr:MULTISPECIES: immunity 42 family protein [Photorhabdus]PQQ22532.1 hypothetical protein C6H66_23100 [Photorhabdus hindustanensis]QXF32909.1 hypothetical protein B0X70_06905 [Photorhabdus akhurstii]UJD74707.1 hypothetical protein CE143_06825 [Photorhabdus luminescens]
MIFGDPYRFAVLIQHLPEWSDDTYKNGLFHFCIDGFFFPEEIRTSTLWVDVFSLKDNTNALFSFQENKALFEKGTKDAFNFMLGMISPELIGQDEPENFEQSYQYQASTENINDAGFVVFAVSHGDMVRILGAKYSELKQDEHGNGFWETITNPDIREAILYKSEVNEIISKAFEYYSTI